MNTKYDGDAVRQTMKWMKSVGVYDTDKKLLLTRLGAIADLLDQQAKGEPHRWQNRMIFEPEEVPAPWWEVSKEEFDYSKSHPNGEGYRIETRVFYLCPAPTQAEQEQADPRTLTDFVNLPDAERVVVGQKVADRVDQMMKPADPVKVDVEAVREVIDYHRNQAKTIRESEHYDDVIGMRTAERHDRLANKLATAIGDK